MSAMSAEIMSPLLGQPFAQAQIKDEFKAPRHWSFLGESTGNCNAENVSI